MTGQEVRGPWELACRAAARCGGSRKFPGSDCLRWKVSLHRTRTSPDRVHCLCWAWLLSLPRAQQREFTWTGVSAFSPSGPLPGGSCQRGRCWVPMSRRFPVPASAALLGCECSRRMATCLSDRACCFGTDAWLLLCATWSHKPPSETVEKD